MPGVVLVGEEVDDGDEQQRDGLGEVDERGELWVGQDGPGVAQVGEDDAGGPGAGQQRVRVDVHDRVIVRLRDRHRRSDLLDDRSHAGAASWDAGADVDDLPDACLACQEADGALEERAVGAGDPPPVTSSSSLMSSIASVDGGTSDGP